MPPPKLLAVAVNVTGVPEQIEPDGDAAIATVGVIGLIVVPPTDIVIVLEVAEFVVRQLPPVRVIVHVTASLFASVVLVYIFELVFCTLTLFTLKL